MDVRTFAVRAGVRTQGHRTFSMSRTSTRADAINKGAQEGEPWGQQLAALTTESASGSS
jgi:hypothetical protein